MVGESGGDVAHLGDVSVVGTVTTEGFTYICIYRNARLVPYWSWLSGVRRADSPCCGEGYSGANSGYYEYE